jgi:hypothetical protein
MTQPEAYAHRRDNGLTAPAYVALAEIDASISDNLLDALRRARIAAYVEQLADERERLFVAADERVDARTIIQSAARAALNTSDTSAVAAADLLAGLDTDAEFAALTADWHVDTITAVREAEKDLNREDSDWRSRLYKPPVDDPEIEEHYVPPPPPPLPRLAPMTIAALLIVILSIAVLATGTLLGMPDQFTLLLGVGGLLVGAGMLVMRLRAQPDEEDDDDDGAVL